jgi:hypothetical protein
VGAYNEPSIEPNISLVNISRSVDHLADEREDTKEGDGFNHAGVAKEKDLEFGERFPVLHFHNAIFVGFMVEYFGIVDGLIDRAAEERGIF